MKDFLIGLTFIGLISLGACSASETCARPNIDADKIKTDITQLLQDQDRAWNAGDIEKFMAYYWKSENLRFASAGKINRGWQSTLDSYKARYPDKQTMGILAFKNLDIKVLSPQYVQVFGRWELTRDFDKPGGLFTLLLKRQNGKWVIVSDHTSSDEK